jgi:iron complex outermembrane receptor protein
MSARSTLHAHRQLRLGAVMLGVLALTSSPIGALAQSGATQQSAVTRFDLPAAPLATTLRAIARASGRRIEFDSGPLTDMTAPAVVGNLTVEEAVGRATAGREMKLSVEAGGVIRIAAGSSSQSVTIAAKRDQAELAFKADRSDTATRSGASLMDTPASVTIITSKVLESQQALSVRDALANVSGMGFQQSPQGSPTFSIRGFGQTAATMNGVSDNSASLAGVLTVERIEVLKGPQAILAGSGSLGGGVNIVTKKPQADPIRTLIVQTGSHGDTTIGGDIAGAVTEDRKLSYRVIGSKSEAGQTAWSFDGRDESALLPQLRWKDASTDMIVGLSYGKQYLPVPLYTFARRDGVILPRPELRPGNAYDGFSTEQKRAFYQLEQKVTDGITLISRLQRSLSELGLHVRTPGGLEYATGAANSSPNGFVTFSGGTNVQDENTTSGDHYLRIAGETGSISHKLSLGINHSDAAYSQTAWNGPSARARLYPANTSFVFPDFVTTDAAINLQWRQDTKNVGGYIQDLMSWGDWSLLLNARRNTYTFNTKTTFLPSGSVSQATTKQTVTTPGVGVIYSVTQEVSVYASLSKGYVPRTNVLCGTGGGFVPPIASKNTEIGAKFDLLQNKLGFTVAAFQLDQDNTLLFNRPANCYDVLNGQTTKGFEADLQGQIAPGWNAVVNYTYATLKDASNAARIFTGAPKNKFSLWTTYELQNDAWRGLGFGMGVSGQSRTNGSTIAARPLPMPGQVQLDMSLFYNKGPWSTTFGVKNVADRLLYGNTTGAAFVPISEGRNFMLTVKRDFN